MLCDFDELPNEFERYRQKPKNDERWYCGKNMAKGKFGLAYIIETPRRKCVQPMGWELEFEDTPSNISNKCNKMTEWVNRPPIGECLECNALLKCASTDLTRFLNETKQESICYCTECERKDTEPLCCCQFTTPDCTCRPPPLCCDCYTKLLKLQNCCCKNALIRTLDNQCCYCLAKEKRRNKRSKCRSDKRMCKSSERSKNRCRSRTNSKPSKKLNQSKPDDYLDYVPKKEKPSKREYLYENSSNLENGTPNNVLNTNTQVNNSDKGSKQAKNFSSSGDDTRNTGLRKSPNNSNAEPSDVDKSNGVLKNIPGKTTLNNSKMLTPEPIRNDKPNRAENFDGPAFDKLRKKLPLNSTFKANDNEMLTSFNDQQNNKEQIVSYYGYP